MEILTVKQFTNMVNNRLPEGQSRTEDRIRQWCRTNNIRKHGREYILYKHEVDQFLKRINKVGRSSWIN